MDLNRLPITPVSLEVFFACKSKTELRDVFIRERGEREYQNLLRSSRPLIVQRVLQGKLWFYIYL